MSNCYSRGFLRSDLPQLRSLVTENAKFRLPGACYLLARDISWRLPGSDPENNLRLWFDDSGLAAYAWFESNSAITFDLRHDINLDHPLSIEIVEWCTERRFEENCQIPWLVDLKSMADWEMALVENKPGLSGSSRYLQFMALDSDHQRIQFLESLGYEPTEHFEFHLSRSLDTEIPDEDLPAGMQLRHVEFIDIDERVSTHRDAWFKSGFSREQYLEVRSSEVVEDQNGRFASYCIGWADRELKLGSFEPVGTRPAYRKNGLARQVNYEGLRRMQLMGMHNASIGTAGFNERALALYLSCGFNLVDKARTFIKCVD